MSCTHRVYKEFQNWKESTIDCLVLSLYQLQNFYLNEVKRGMSGSGQYQLKDRYEYLKANYYAFQCTNIDSPEDIVRNMRDGCMFDSVHCKLPELKEIDRNAALHVTSNIDNESTCFEPEGDIRQDFDKPSALYADSHPQSFKQKRRDELNSLKPNVSTYLLARAYEVLRNQNITYNTKFGMFIIKQPREMARAVTLFPKVNCTCHSTGECYHIVAAKINLGMNVGQTTNVANLTKLRRNSKKKKEKRSGRKRPRALDVSGTERVLIECL